jgi:aspartyl-tRNA(Asn)/glutamyl-tRNA(Gln) amidotransferase subunit B
MKYYPKIGLEIHIELKTKSKMFCNCKNDPDEKHPNINICPVCLGHPGTLPVINQEAVRKTIKTGLALNCEISRHTFFERKNYFYPDLPKGYQISQYSTPLCKNGFLEIDGKKIRIRRVHLEEDTGRLIHEKDCSLVDFNRAGIPLMELVTEPDIESPKEARKFAEELQLILRYLDVSDADMEKGEMRVEANISVSEKRDTLGTKVEIKNLNSFKAVEKALEYEIERQKKILESGKKVAQETRGWDPAREITFPQREKEEAQDYRYFPEPDLPPLEISEEIIEKIRAEIPELPQQKRERLKREYGLDEKAIEIFVKDKDFGEYFEKVVSEFDPNLPREKLSRLIKLATNYLTTDLLGLLKGASVKGEDFLITPENFAEFITLIEEGKISSKIAKIVLEEMFKTGADPSHIVEEKGLILITDKEEIEKIAHQVISENQKAVLDFKKGKETALQFLIGQVMAKTKGKANPKLAREILLKILKSF